MLGWNGDAAAPTPSAIDAPRMAGRSAPLPLLSSRFGGRRDPFDGTLRRHAGIDMPAPPGSAVVAAEAGLVRRAAMAGGYGQLVEIDHGGGLRTRYAHLSRILVREGDWVERGRPIAAVGSTGRSTGNHLHFEVRRNGIARDPLAYLGSKEPVYDLAPAPIGPDAPHISQFAHSRDVAAEKDGDGA